MPGEHVIQFIQYRSAQTEAPAAKEQGERAH
jgi:hypothetical protein